MVGLDMVFFDVQARANIFEHFFPLHPSRFHYLSQPRLRNLRSVDRKINEMRYPTLFYPEVYLLDGGYKNFYRLHPEHCEPRGYVEMQDARFVSRCEDDLSQSRKTWKRHKSLADVGSLGRRNSASF